VPDQVIACGFDTTTVGVFSHLEPHGWSVYLEIYGGGYGASVSADGCDAVDGPLSNCSNTPVEALDQDFRFFRVLEYALRAGSAGAGEFRGGLGFQRRFQVLTDDVKLALYSDRFRRPPDGVFDGAPGRTGFCEIRRGGQTIRLRSKDEVMLQRGDIVTLAVGGGGGYGDPTRRSVARIADDVADGYVVADRDASH